MREVSPQRRVLVLHLLTLVLALTTACQRDPFRLRTVPVPAQTDSAWAARTAADAFPYLRGKPFRVAAFCSHSEGYLINVGSAETNVLGSGGVVWVTKSGGVQVLALNQ